MKAFWLVPALALLAATVATAQIYTWVDDEGNTHYGDSPPDTADAEALELPEGPSDDEIATAREDLRRTLEASKQSDQSHQQETEATGAAESGAGEQTTDTGSILDRELTCFTPLSDFVTGASGQLNAPINPSQLNDGQEILLKNLFSRIGRNWRGDMEDVSCKGEPQQWSTRSLSYELKTVVEWDANDARLTVESETVGKLDKSAKDLVQNYKVAGGLYIHEGEISSVGWTDMTAEGNKVEVLMQQPDSVAFLIKRRAPRGYWVSEIRHMELRQDRFLFRQVYFAKDIMTGWRTWVLRTL